MTVIGTTVESIDYDPHGNAIAGITPRQRYIKKEVDRESDLGDFSARKYDGDDGSFPTVDEWWERYHGTSPYVYSFDNPVRVSDPSGRGGGWNRVLNEEIDGGGGFGPMGTVGGAGASIVLVKMLESIADKLSNYFHSESSNPAEDHHESAEGSASKHTDALTAKDIKDKLGSLPKGKQCHVRTVENDGEMKALYDELTKGGTKIDAKTYPGEVTKMPDGTLVKIRIKSKSGGAIIDIDYPNGGTGKVRIQ